MIIYSNKNKKNNHAYLRYLTQLLPQIPSSSSTYPIKSIHIGESHCLSFTNQVFLMNGVNSQIKPSHVKGAKVWHLGNQKTNNFKICFKNIIKPGLDIYQFILLSFGDIDCRHDEGILKYCLKHKLNIEASTQATAKSYAR